MYFIIGTFIGSFASLAAYRLPIKEDIFIKHSYCPNCKALLTIKDLIPILSYIFLKGKCSHCGQKIRIRYLVLEIASGVLFLAFMMSFKIDVFNINVNTFFETILISMFFVNLVLIAGIDKENIKVQNSVLIFAIIIASAYLLMQGLDIYNIAIILGAILLQILGILCFKKNAKILYLTRVASLILVSILFVYNIWIVIISAMLSMILLCVYKSTLKKQFPFAMCYILFYGVTFILLNML